MAALALPAPMTIVRPFGNLGKCCAIVWLGWAAATFELELDSWHDAGTHRIFVGKVLAASISGLPTLAYHHRKFGKFVAF